MNGRMILASLAGAVLLASPMAASASGTKTAKPAAVASKDTCYCMDGPSLKNFKAKASAAKKAAQTK